jgi:hypothetical protein
MWPYVGWDRRLNKESFMVKTIGAILFGLMAISGPALAESSNAKALAKCEIAEVNPVTGYVGCIKPLGAPVDPPPAEAAPPCNPDQDRGQWTWGPNFNELKGM